MRVMTLTMLFDVLVAYVRACVCVWLVRNLFEDFKANDMVQQDYSWANGSDARAFSSYQMHENASRTHHIYTVSLSCEYACGLSIFYNRLF